MILKEQEHQLTHAGHGKYEGGTNIHTHDEKKLDTEVRNVHIICHPSRDEDTKTSSI